MAKAVHTDVLDGALNIVKSNATKMVACTSQPTTYAEANATYKLAEVTLASGDFTLSAGVTNGRRATVAAKSGITASATGNATHVALLDTAATKLLYVTTCPSTAIASGGTVSIGAWDIEIGDPV
jgi:hypothetical protein